MSHLRDQLGHARQAYRRARYPGDLADDLFARLDAGEKLDVDGAEDVSDDSSSHLRIGPGSATPTGSRWRPLLAMAAAVAIVATTVFTLRYAAKDRPSVEIAKDVTTDVRVPPTKTVDPVVETPTAETTEVAAAEAADFSVVPTYQSFAISVPTSLSLASLEEYEQQAQEQKEQDSTSAGAESTVQ
jgi:hypothetical protein